MSNISHVIGDALGRSVVIATHDGKFHLDELVAILLVDTVRLYMDQSSKPLTLLRTRDANELAKADLVIDVGNKYDAIKYFDHHQNDEYVRDKSATRLVWDDVKNIVAKFLLERYCPHDEIYWRSNTEIANAIIVEMYDVLIRPISDWDVGKMADVSNVMAVQHVVKAMARSGERGTSMDERFIEAYEYVKSTVHYLVRDVVLRIMNYYKTKWSMDYQKGDLCILDSRGPWYSILTSNPMAYGHFKLLLYPTASGHGWYIQSMHANAAACIAPDDWIGSSKRTVIIKGKKYTITFVNNRGDLVCIHGNADAAKAVAKHWIKERTSMNNTSKSYMVARAV